MAVDRSSDETVVASIVGGSLMVVYTMVGTMAVNMTSDPLIEVVVSTWVNV